MIFLIFTGYKNRLKKAAELIIAHRGESFDAPENTLAAINLSWERNVRAVEIDIRLTVDRHIVVFHDKNTLRVTGEKKVISKSRLDELRILDAGSFKGSRWRDERIPDLAEVLGTVPEWGKLIIEIKSDDAILEILKKELEKSKLNSTNTEIIAFDLRILEKARKMMPDIRMLWLLDLDYTLPWWLCRINRHEIMNKLSDLQLDGIDVWSGKLLNREFIDFFKNAGFSVYTWTVNDPGKARQLAELGVDGITTDRPSWLINQLE